MFILNLSPNAKNAKGFGFNTHKHNNNSCGNESIEVCITQNIGKERENSYQKMKISPDKRHTNTQKLN